VGGGKKKELRPKKIGEARDRERERERERESALPSP
jgi:hypothetical protein